MKLFNTFTLSLLSIISAHQLTLTSENFDKEVGSGNWLIMYYSPTCKYSKMMLGPWKESTEAKAKDGKDRGFHFATVDCKALPDLCKKNKIVGFPTINVYQTGQLKEEYMGDSITSELTKYIDIVSTKYQTNNKKKY
ncbi:thioredoxin-like protein [Neoconidiobolus thromboides FSU 785]|nr:thioredoxin-like protein [Neoconidiobolus thromboides FSU 785]